MSNRRQDRILNLQPLRAIAAVLVFYHHFFDGQMPMASFGDFCVCFFIMLSGYVLYGSTVNNWRNHLRSGTLSVRRFMFNRLSKIYPLYLLMWIVTVVVLPYQLSLKGTLLGLVMMQSWVPIGEVYWAGNAPAWFVCDLMFASLIFLPMFRLGRRRPRLLRMLIGGYFICYAAIVFTIPDSLVLSIVYINPVMQISSFLLGIVLYRAQMYVRPRLGTVTRPVAAALQLVAVAAVIISMAFFSDIPQRFSVGMYWWPSVALLIVAFSVTDNVPTLLTRLFHTKPMQQLGNVSYGVYLIHFIFIYMWMQCVQSSTWPLFELPIFLQSVILLAVITALAFLSRRTFELPIARWLSSMANPRR